MSILLVQWQGDINGSRYTIHEADSCSKLDAFWAVDRLGDPGCAKWIHIGRNYLSILSDQDLEQLDDSGVVDNKDLEEELSAIWAKRTQSKKERKSKYIKVKHYKWGLIDQHRAVMQDHLGKKLPSNMVVHHKNGNTHDNRLENLEVMSLSEHSRMHCLKGNWHKRLEKSRKTFQKGHTVGPRLFTPTEAYAIRDMFKQSGESIRAFARSLDLCHHAVGQIIRGKTYV